MQISNLTSIFNFAAFLVCFFSAIKMYRATKKEKRNINISYYFYSFVFLSAYLLVNSLPLLFINDPYFILLLTALFRPLLLIGGMFLFVIPLNLSGFKKTEKLYIYIILFATIISEAFAFLGVKDVSNSSFQKGGLEQWIRPENPFILWSMLIIGIFFVSSLLFATIFYFRFAVTEKENEVAFGKSLMMGGGCLFFLCAAASKYIFGLGASNFTLVSIISSLFFIMGVVAFVASVGYKGEKKEYYKIR